MNENEIQPHLAVAAHKWLALYRDGEYEERIILEIRQTSGKGFLLHTNVKGTVYHIFDTQFCYVLESFLSQLPSSSSISLLHEIPLQFKDNSERIVKVVERIASLEIGDNIIPSYQLELDWDGHKISTQPLPDMQAALYWLATQLHPNSYFKICTFCDFVYEYGIYGHTDGRHDLLYCFRDNFSALEQIRSAPLKSSDFPEILLKLALQDIDAFHTCSSFTLIRDYHSRLDNVKGRLEKKGSP